MPKTTSRKSKYSAQRVEVLGQLINLSGKMRMLSHRAVLFLALEEFEDPEFLAARKKHFDALKQFCDIYKMLLVGDPRAGVQKELIQDLHATGVMTAERQEIIEQFIYMVRSIEKGERNFTVSDLSNYLDAKLIVEIEDVLAGIKKLMEDDIALELKEGQRSAQTVDKALSMIEELSLTVRMISLNASIEAKRAGLAGAGFDVIAQEIQSIAERSGETVRRIRLELT